MILWRIAAETRRHTADDLSGAGAAAHPGRWNGAGAPVVYAATSLALAVLETAAHIDDAGLPLNRFVLRIDVPDAVHALCETVAATSLPATWQAVPAGRASVAFGTAWLHSLRSPILLLPSAIVPEEPVALLNPRHPLAAQLKAQVVRPFEFNRLFRHG